jgi:hypothetical protein
MASEIELPTTKATNSMGWVFVHVLRSALRAPWGSRYQKKDNDCDDAQDKGAGDNPDYRVHFD